VGVGVGLAATCQLRVVNAVLPTPVSVLIWLPRQSGTSRASQSASPSHLPTPTTQPHLPNQSIDPIHHSDALLNMQNDLPLLSDYDKECLATLGQVGWG